LTCCRAECQLGAYTRSTCSLWRSGDRQRTELDQTGNHGGA